LVGIGKLNNGQGSCLTQHFMTRDMKNIDTIRTQTKFFRENQNSHLSPYVQNSKIVSCEVNINKYNDYIEHKCIWYDKVSGPIINN
jgi:hypothetical protein